MVSLDISNDEGESSVNILGCKLSQLSITYLDIPLHFKKLTSEH
jgi:hypothetical protein